MLFCEGANKTTDKILELAPANGFNWNVMESALLVRPGFDEHHIMRRGRGHLIIFESFSRKFPASVTAGPVLGYAGGH